MLIGLTGRAGAGKDTVYEVADQIYGSLLLVERRSFADVLYQSAAATLGVTVEDLARWKRDPEVRVAVGTRYQDDDAGFHHFAPAVEITMRQYLQRYGTEAHRDMFGEDFWANAVYLGGHLHHLVFVTDVRFENEARRIHEAGGVMARVLGPDDGLGNDHASEQPIKDGLIDYVVHNVIRDDPERTYLKGQVTGLVSHLGRLETMA